MTTDSTQAAQVDPLDAFVQEAIDQDSSNEAAAIPNTDSAPVVIEDANEPKPTEAEKPTGDGFQKRIDKKTADFYAEKRRADALQKRLDTIDEASAKEALKKPKLDDAAIDYDEELFNQATLDYEVKVGVQSALDAKSEETKAQKQKEASEAVLTNFTERVNKLDKKDFDEKAGLIPILPEGVADAMMQSELGPEMIYHLGGNPEKAQELANMSPAMAMMELGKISAQLSVKPEIKTSAAPTPIEPVKAGSALSSDVGDEMSIDAWMAKYN